MTPPLHDRDAVGQRHRLDLVVRDVDHRVLELLVQPLDLDAQFGAQLGVEVGQRLVEQEHIDVAHQRPADRDALALAAGQLPTACASAAARSAGSRRRARCAARSRPSAGLGILQAEGQVSLHRHLRIERVGLEHHADAAILGLFPGDVAVLDEDLPVGDVEQAGDAVEQRRLAAAGRPSSTRNSPCRYRVEVFSTVDGAEGLSDRSRTMDTSFCWSSENRFHAWLNL
jgi:hypothetical protein